ncbi:hypothetical protein [Arsenophonus nasoniae]|uniref:Uncharacterized protein n=1 Tax=Arsenophonus nasoniae TaxID=638 RepID=A0AA95K169_9GAMM|nr:hypothetical protein [Arsenophonus nasoniae]WGL96284.1 hypothetical protein QE207_06875 [Arsenophonus nasoniae]
MFKFELNQEVKILVSDEEGNIKGRADYVNSDNQYLLCYKAADGRAVDKWLYEDEISLLTPDSKKCDEYDL